MIRRSVRLVTAGRAVLAATALRAEPAALAGGAEDATYTVTTADLTAGFTDADGDTLSVTGLTAEVEMADQHASHQAPIVVASEGESRFAAALHVISVPAVDPALDFVLSAMVGHLFGYEAALAIDARDSFGIDLGSPGEEADGRERGEVGRIGVQMQVKGH